MFKPGDVVLCVAHSGVGKKKCDYGGVRTGYLYTIVQHYTDKTVYISKCPNAFSPVEPVTDHDYRIEAFVLASPFIRALHEN